MNFKEIELSEPIQRALQEVGYEEATEIQELAIPPILSGRDLLGCAQTGTGKTAAFALPILQHLSDRPKQKVIRALILTPTRELAIQIQENIKKYSHYLPYRSIAIFGGVSQNPQVDALNKGIEILVATPGRLLDLMQQGIVSLRHLEILVLDEADHMLDIGFIHDIKKILAKVPEKRQTLFFSATMPKEIRKFAQSILHKPVEIAVSPESTTAELVEQSVYYVEKQEKTNFLIDLFRLENMHHVLVFTRTKYGADKLVKKLNKQKISAAAIHGNKSQNARQRALADFKTGKIDILVATDIAARGIDISQLPFVVNYELPNVSETYVHRIGRTGRAGQAGQAISFCDEEQKKDLRNIEKLIGFKIPVVQLENQIIH